MPTPISTYGVFCTKVHKNAGLDIIFLAVYYVKH